MKTWVCDSMGASCGVTVSWPVIPKRTSRKRGAEPSSAASSTAIALPLRDTLANFLPSRVEANSSAEPAMTAAWRTSTAAMRRPSARRRSPWATVSTSGSSGIVRDSGYGNVDTGISRSPQSSPHRKSRSSRKHCEDAGGAPSRAQFIAKSPTCRGNYPVGRSPVRARGMVKG